MSHHRPVGRHRNVSRTRPRSAGGAQWGPGGRVRPLVNAGAGASHRRRGQKACARRTYLRSSGAGVAFTADGGCQAVKIIFLGLSVTSSWGNGHATTYRGLMRGLAARRHDVLFLERDKPWYASNRDLPNPPYGRTRLYTSLDDLKTRFGSEVRGADVVIVGSYVPEGVAV